MIVGLSLCLLNGGIFPLDHIPDQLRSILEREQRIQSRSGSDCIRKLPKVEFLGLVVAMSAAKYD